LERLKGRLPAPDQEERVSALPTKSRPRRRQRRLSSAQVSELTAAAKDGVPLSELAHRYDIDRSTVVDHLNRPVTPRRYPALGEAQVEEAVGLYEAGMSFREVGRTLGVHASTARQYLIRAGVGPERPRGSMV
jgi:hypothetical protein